MPRHNDEKRECVRLRNDGRAAGLSLRSAENFFSRRKIPSTEFSVKIRPEATGGRFAVTGVGRGGGAGGKRGGSPYRKKFWRSRRLSFFPARELRARARDQPLLPAWILLYIISTPEIKLPIAISILLRILMLSYRAANIGWLPPLFRSSETLFLAASRLRALLLDTSERVCVCACHATFRQL